MGYQVPLGNTTVPLEFLLVSSSDHVSGATGKTPTVRLSKAGQPFAAPLGAVTQKSAAQAPGVYMVAANADDADTEGPLLLHATAAGCDPCDVEFDVASEDA
jgi:hypothetical protein